MAAIGQKLELALIRRVVGNVGAIYRSPAMRELRSEEEQRRQAEPIELSSAPGPWFDLREGARGWGFAAVFAASVYVTYRFVAWLFAVLSA